jgi:hypothetical protein
LGSVKKRVRISEKSRRDSHARRETPRNSSQMRTESVSFRKQSVRVSSTLVSKQRGY